MKLFYKLLITFLVVSIAPLFVITTLIYVSGQSFLVDIVVERLENAASIKKQKISSFNELATEAVTIFANKTSVVFSLTNFAETGEGEEIETLGRLVSQMRSENRHFDNIYVTDPSGVVVASSISSQLGKDKSKTEAFARGKKGFNNALFIKDKEGVTRQVLTHPITNVNSLVGVLIVEADINDILVLASDYGGLGETGETILVLDGDSDALVLNSLRFDQNAALERRVPKDNDQDPVVSAVLKRELLVENSLDYRGEEVIAITRYIPQSNLGMVVKMDRQEALANLRAFFRDGLVIIFVLLLVVVLITQILARSLTKPINKLLKAVNELSEGNLSFKVRVKSTDEVGMLAKAFSDMAGKLQKSYSALEEKVRQRTKELEKTKKGLEGEVKRRTKELEQSKDSLEEEVLRRTKDLQERSEDLEKLNQQMVGRELKMIALKEEIRKLKKKMS